jgi:D-alanyl-D-alanine carboxypeptidase/D-alanyl-D-alanine-endopeptidase (penicillin-binding protein 4)
VLLVLLVLVLCAAAGIGAYATTRAARHVDAAPSTTPPPPPPSAYLGASDAPTPAPTPTSTPDRAAGVTRALAAPLAAGGLGQRVRATVLDVTTGVALLDRTGAVPAAPASTAKLLTAAALLTVRQPTDRITTTVRAGANGAVVLVGGGDPTLSGATTGDPPYAGAARLRDLASQLRAAGVRPTRVLVDDSLFTGPDVSPSWAAEDVPTDYGAAITAVMTDGGRDTPDATIRSATPDLAAGHELAAALGVPDAPVARGRAAAGATTLARVRSAPFATLIGQMLQESDNVIAECLARQVALTEHRAPSFLGAAASVRTVLTGIGLDPGAGLVDGSGLAAADRVSPRVLAGVLRAVATRPGLSAIVGGLPVAAWSGTLADRYVTGSARSGAGIVRAKTGTLSGVSALAGLVHDRSGRLLAFAIIADRAGSTAAAEAALDAVAARLADCGCG